jgi:hypothetical protein
VADGGNGGTPMAEYSSGMGMWVTTSGMVRWK